MRRAVIFLHGNRPETKTIKKYLKKGDFIIAADGGAEYVFEAGLVPHIAIGDFDSLKTTFQKRLRDLQIETIKYPREKDETDSQLAIQYALKKGYNNMLLFGVYGSRVDHVMANLAHIASLQEGVRVFKIIEGEQEIYCVRDKLVLKGKKGEYVSLVPLKGDAKGVFTKGLKWRLYNDTLAFGEPRGISNEFIGTTAEIDVTQGILLVVHTRK